MNDAHLPVVVMISGNGSNLQAIINRINDGFLPIELRAVISNRPEAFGLQRAHQVGVLTKVLDDRDYPDRNSFDQALQRLLDGFAPQLIILAGFMRVLTAELVLHYHGRILNIHPSLLPHYRGLHTHARVLAAGDTEHGASVHFVTTELDNGPVILQARVPVLPEDDITTLAARVLCQEHYIYPQVIHWFAKGRLQLTANGVVLDGKPLLAPLQWQGLLVTSQ